MRPQRTLLALAIVLGFAAGEARALSELSIDHNYSVKIAGQRFGFSDGTLHHDFAGTSPWRVMHLGPFGEKHVPFTAPQCLTFFGLTVGLLLFAAVAIIVWRRRWRAKPVEA